MSKEPQDEQHKEKSMREESEEGQSPRASSMFGQLALLNLNIGTVDAIDFTLCFYLDVHYKTPPSLAI